MNLAPRPTLVLLLAAAFWAAGLASDPAFAAPRPRTRAAGAVTKAAPPPAAVPAPPEAPAIDPGEPANRLSAPPAASPPPSGVQSVALFEFRNDVKQLADLPERLTQALTQNTSLTVINLAAARRRLGPSVDAEVARCDGETQCLSLVGQRLGATEVLLLAVSQLGDVVLALQRIGVSDQIDRRANRDIRSHRRIGATTSSEDQHTDDGRSSRYRRGTKRTSLVVAAVA